MRRALLLALLLPSAAWAQQSAPYKLVIASSEGGLVVVDYPSAARCERAKAAIDAEMERRNAEIREREARGTVIVHPGWRARAICIPG